MGNEPITALPSDWSDALLGRCEHKRTARVDAKCADLCTVTMGQRESDGYVPEDMGIGGGDYIAFSYCLDCGRIEGTWPIERCELDP